jgi:hypothetical protein
MAEHDNVRAVLTDALEHGRADVALRLGGAVWLFWVTRGYWSEGRRWLESALAGTMKSDPHLRVDALWGAGLLVVWQGDLERGDAAADELLALGEETDSTWARAVGVHIAAIVAHRRGNWNQAVNLGFTTLMLGDVQRARSLLREGLIAAREIGLVEGFIIGFVGLGAAYAREDPARAARLIGHAHMLSEETALELQLIEGRVHDETEGELRTRLGEDTYATAYAEGRALALEDALALALRPD